MKKINLFLFLAFILLFYSCKNEVNNDVRDFRKSETAQQLDVKNIEKVIDVENDSVTDFYGKWLYVNNNDELDYYIELKNDKEKVIGSHCFIKGLMGETIDCPEETSFEGSIEENILKGSFKSDWEEKRINVIMKIKNKKLYLTLQSEIGNSLFLDNMVFIKGEL